MPEITPAIRFHIRTSHDPHWHEPPRLLYDCELVWLSGGRFQLRIEDREFSMQPGDVVIIGPFIDHESWTRSDQTAKRNCLHFDWDRSHSHIKSPLFCPYGNVYEAKYMHPVNEAFAGCLRLVSPAAANQPILPVLEDIFERLAAGDGIGETLMYSVLHYFLHLQGRREPERVVSQSERAIRELKNFIDAHYAERLTLEDFSDLAQLSPSHLCQAFRRSIGMPPIRYLNELRLSHACRLLRNSDLNVGEIGRAVGFPDNNYFARFFKRKKGLSPGAFARRHGR